MKKIILICLLISVRLYAQEAVKKAAEDAAIAHGAGKHTFGYTGLKEIFGQDIADKIAEWLDYRGGDESAGAVGQTKDVPLDEKPKPAKNSTP